MSTRTQNREFDAAAELAKQWRRLQMTAPVDDDFPEVKFDYDRAARAFVKAWRANGGVDDPISPHLL